jgi:hypothetical protein
MVLFVVFDAPISALPKLCPFPPLFFPPFSPLLLSAGGDVLHEQVGELLIALEVARVVAAHKLTPFEKTNFGNQDSLYRLKAHVSNEGPHRVL